ncbi:MAG: hypothetical protein KGN36_02265, partial [Acidobacteriota bacterium]|nr:hypothetical protein [Acidobacteriota bacterium]
MGDPGKHADILRKLAAMEGAPHPDLQFIPTGFRALDLALGGGFPRGHIVELFGPAGSGKTTIALQSIAHVQTAALNAAYIDADHTFDAAYAAGLGVALERLPLIQPAFAEQAMEIACTL